MNLYYALDDSSYTLKNALLWGNCIEHFKKADQGSFFDRTVHVIIGVVELFPVLGQIASIIEKIAVGILRSPHQPQKTSNHASNDLDISNKHFIPKDKAIALPKKTAAENNQEEQDKTLTDWNNEFKNLITTDEQINDPKTNLKKLRESLFNSTVKACDNGFYLNNKLVKLDETLTKSMIEKTNVSLPTPLESLDQNPLHQTVFKVVYNDTISLAKKYADENLNPVVIQFINGEKKKGVFVRSNYYVAHASHKKGFPHQYVAYTPQVQVFRSSELDYTRLAPPKALDLAYEYHEPFCISIITVHSIKCPSLYDLNLSDDPSLKTEFEEKCDKEIKIVIPEADSYQDYTKSQMRSILREAYRQNHQSLILDANRCGDIKNFKLLNVIYWKEVLAEDEFKGRFKQVDFVFEKNTYYKALSKSFREIL